MYKRQGGGQPLGIVVRHELSLGASDGVVVLSQRDRLVQGREAVVRLQAEASGEWLQARLAASGGQRSAGRVNEHVGNDI